MIAVGFEPEDVQRKSILIFIKYNWLRDAATSIMPAKGSQRKRPIQAPPS